MYGVGNEIAKDILNSSASTKCLSLPDIDNEIEVVTYVAAEGDISIDLLSPGNQAHSRSDRELHVKCMISAKAQVEIQTLREQHPDKQVMLIADKGTMGAGSSRMSGANSVDFCGPDGRLALTYPSLTMPQALPEQMTYHRSS